MCDRVGVRAAAIRPLEEPVAVNRAGNRLRTDAVIGGHEVRDIGAGDAVVQQGAVHRTSSGVAEDDLGNGGAELTRIGGGALHVDFAPIGEPDVDESFVGVLQRIGEVLDS